jgi:probable F420-dependent oxidoreductase
MSEPKKKVAVTLPAGPRWADTLARVQWAEANGYTDAWWGESVAPDALTATAALGALTKDIRIGIAISSVFSRTPAVFASTANALEQIMPGRFVLGLGSSSPGMVEGWHGQVFEKPLSRVKETTMAIRSMLAGEKSNVSGVTINSHGYRQMGMESPPPIYLAALRSKMIETAAETGDGVIFNLWPKSALPKMMEHVKIGAERAGKKWQDVEIVNRAMVLVTDDKPEARDRFRAGFGPYYATSVYNNFLGWAGFEEAAARILEGWQERDRNKTGAALTDDLIDEIAIIGSAEECRDRIKEDAEGGVHTHIIAPQSNDADETQRTFDAFSSDVFSF